MTVFGSGIRRHKIATNSRRVVVCMVAFLLIGFAQGGASPIVKCKGILDCGVANAKRVVVYRVQNRGSLVLESLTESSVAPDERAILSADVAQDLIRFVRADTTYLMSPGVASSCAFLPDYAFEFSSPPRASVWWLVAEGCRRAALATSKSNVGDWTDNARFLSAFAIERLKQCNGSDGAQTWPWANEKSCFTD